MLQHAFELKLGLASSVGLIAAVTDVATDVHGWEDLSLKGILIAAVIFIGRLFLQQQQQQRDQQREHKAEIEKTWDAHKQDAEKREVKYCTALDANSKCLTELVVLTREQTDYFKAVTRDVVNEKLKGRPQLPS